MIALRERNFRLYWLGQAVSNTGNWMQTVALGWFIFQISDTPLVLGLLGLVQSVPIFALSLVGGVLADRFPRLKLLLVTQSVTMLLAIVLALADILNHSNYSVNVAPASNVAYKPYVESPSRPMSPGAE